MANISIEITFICLEFSHDSITDIFTVVMLTENDALPQVWRFKEVNGEMVKL